MRRTRTGFTLIELLVVIAIISILAALIMAGVQRTRESARNAQCRTDLSQLEVALGQFKARFGCYPPCRGSGPNGTFKLATLYNSTSPPNDPTQAHATDPEVEYLRLMFPRFNPNVENGLRRLQADLSPTVYKAAYNAGDEIPATAPIFLDPNQCLVFFLSGGVYTNYSGFSANHDHPFMGPKAEGSSPSVLIDVSRMNGSPYFEFQASRMVSREEFSEDYFVKDLATNAVNSGKLRFDNDTAIDKRRDQPWFADAWGTPYLYLSSNIGNDYPFNTATTALKIGPWGGKYSPNPTSGVIPYSTGSNTSFKFKNDKSIQILSAGRDRRIGPGGDFKPGTGLYALNRQGGDDYSNFQQTPLGVTD